MSMVQDLRGSLAADDAEYQRLVQEHSRCDSELAHLIEQEYRSSEDLIQEVTLKKMKLRLKDQMEQRLARYRRETAPR
jgi:uncharacterized protein YdcH (DUF465 family)